MDQINDGNCADPNRDARSDVCGETSPPPLFPMLTVLECLLRLELRKSFGILRHVEDPRAFVAKHNLLHAETPRLRIPVDFVFVHIPCGRPLLLHKMSSMPLDEFTPALFRGFSVTVPANPIEAWHREGCRVRVREEIVQYEFCNIANGRVVPEVIGWLGCSVFIRELRDQDWNRVFAVRDDLVDDRRAAILLVLKAPFRSAINVALSEFDERIGFRERPICLAWNVRPNQKKKRDDQEEKCSLASRNQWFYLLPCITSSSNRGSPR